MIVSPEEQIAECIDLLKAIFDDDLLGVYLYGSSVAGGRRKYSDIDLFVVTKRATTLQEKRNLTSQLLKISGIYMKNAHLPIELTVVIQSEVNPWHYPACFDFQFGDWLRPLFESGNVTPWDTQEMPELALLITQVLLASKTLVGVPPEKLLDQVPYHDFISATFYGLDGLMDELQSDTRNVLLTLARIWCTVETDTIRAKKDAALWAIHRLPFELQPVLDRARAICMGEVEESWGDLAPFLQACAQFIVHEINQKKPSLLKEIKPARTIKMIF